MSEKKSIDEVFEKPTNPRKERKEPQKEDEQTKKEIDEYLNEVKKTVQMSNASRLVEPLSSGQSEINNSPREIKAKRNITEEGKKAMLANLRKGREARKVNLNKEHEKRQNELKKELEEVKDLLKQQKQDNPQEQIKTEIKMEPKIINTPIVVPEHSGSTKRDAFPQVVAPPYIIKSTFKKPQF